MLWSIGLHLKSLARYHKRYLLAQAVSYAAIALVILSGVKVLWMFVEMADYNKTHVYDLQIRADADGEALGEAVRAFLEEAQPSDEVQVYAPPTGGNRVVMATNLFMGELWSWQRLDKELIQGDGDYVWMGSGFWVNDQSFRFPYEEVEINGRAYALAGVCDLDMLCGRADIEGLGEFGVCLPLRTYLKAGYPIDRVVLGLYNAPDSARHQRIAALFGPFMEAPPDPLPRAGLTGFGSLMAAVCAPMILVCMLLMGVQARCVCLQRKGLIEAEYASGASRSRIFWEFYLQFLGLVLVGFLLALYPSDLIYYDYIGFDRPLSLWGWAFTWAVYLGLAALTHGLAVWKAVKGALGQGRERWA
ncbi:MAG TPA: hypothetical protein IAA59_03520 [Candidatus Faecaligallichristensenella faecipullorum]|nr:hypothetical protein [Candidatus Faecaligallichristensenella faecipullorum]